jgi:RNA polymerase sigma-70 factor (ECF subfamily)
MEQRTCGEDLATSPLTRLDDDALNGLIRHCSDELRRYCRRYSRDDDDCCDIEQEVWLLVWEKRAQFQGRGSFSAWLFRLARTVCLRHVQSRNRTTREVDLDCIEAAPPSNVERAIELQELEDELISLVMALPSRRRAVVIARLRFGLSTSETACHMRCSSGTVKAALHQSIASLRGSVRRRGWTVDRFRT